MGQLISVIISFLFIPILIKLKVKLSYTLLISAGILGIISGLGFKTLGEIVLSIFINPSSRATILTVMMVSILGGLMKHYKILVQSLNWNIVLTVVVVLIMKEIILNMGDLLEIFNNMFNANNDILSTMIIFLISSFFFGYITGNQTAALAIILPIISQLYITDEMLYIYTYFAFGSAFMGYFFSPIHLCQAFTLEHMGVSTEELYKEYRFYMPILLLILIISVFVFELILT